MEALGKRPSNIAYEDYEKVKLRDLDDHRILRTPFGHPYNYDEFVIVKTKDFSRDDSAFYSDRFTHWYDYETLNAAKEKCGLEHGDYFWCYYYPDKISEFLTEVTGKKHNVTCIVEGCNVSNGYPYWIIFYKTEDGNDDL